MRLRTIWTLHGLPLSERIDRTQEWICMKIAYFLPRRIRFWSYIHSVNQNVLPNEVVPEVTAMDILKRMDSHAT